MTVAGLVLVRQRPGTGKGVIFMTLEDETGIANIIVWPKIFEMLRPIVIGARFVAVTGRLQNEADVIHVIAERIADLTAWLGILAMRGPEHIGGLARAEEVRRPPSARDKRCPGEDAPTFAFADAPPRPPPGNCTAACRKGGIFIDMGYALPTETVMTDTPDNDISFDRSPPPAGELSRLSPLVRRVVAANPGPFTFTGTCSYIIGRDRVAIIDPGPDE